MNYVYSSPIGTLHIKCSDKFLYGISIITEKSGISDMACHDITEKNADKYPPIVKETRQWLDSYFSGNIPPDIPPVRLEGTTFQKHVWNILLGIPYGATTTYKDIATAVASTRNRESMSAQAVGQAVGHNPIGIIIPCHRVIGSDGSLTGYAWGTDKKKWLLQHEAQTLASGRK
ncbi:MAG: methylated-DNA--[protein]-cysteine S-methyltransferase [Prevotellaceae bacterium]|nr:methylated-DNA--[protein]-cysteine S-methyltransferase [Prevotellaceae bacterium]